MDSVLIIGAIVVAVIVVIVFSKAQQTKKLKEFEDNSVDYIRQIDEFYFGFDDRYIAHSETVQIKSKYDALFNILNGIKIPVNYSESRKITQFVQDYKALESYVEKHNQTFVNDEIDRYDLLLSDIDGKSLDQQQREAVVTDEDHNLVIAGAGAGKTLTIAGTVKYLCEVKKVAPSDILLISFTRKSAQEMTDRIAKKFNYDVQATTFHKLGLDILKESLGKTYDVKDDMYQFLENFFSTKINDDKQMLKNLIEFFAYYLQLPSDLDNFDSLGEVYEHEKTMDLETVKSKYTAATYAEEQGTTNAKEKKTIKNEQVKSLQEVEIANFLFLHGVKYEYEKQYPYQDEEGNRRAYKPDFYLPDYDIYLEHFGVNKEMKCPWLSKVEEEKYIDDMHWKEAFHKKNRTTLLKTYSYYFSEGRLLLELEKMLLEHGVKFKEVDLVDIFNAVYKTQGKKYFSEFINLCGTFISLFKSNGYKLADLEGLSYKNPNYAKNQFMQNRLQVFKDIIRVIIQEYEEDLRNSNAYDFSDMINLSTETINNGYKVHPYKYIIIDEFQDISVARYKLVKAILDQTNAKLLCVGDDWQSIYRFAGSDISLFTSFEEYFGYTKVMRIEKTYRNSQQLIDEAGRFIMENPQQIKKQLKSDKSINKPIVMLFNDDVTKSLKIALDFIVKESKDKSILLLGRTSYDFDVLKQSNLLYGNKIDALHYKGSPDTPISFLTVHKAKGLEADNVILLNFENSILGFPNKIADDPMLETVLSKGDEYIYAEERRLLYVALTRTKNRVYVLVNKSHPSEFVRGLPESNNITYYGNEVEENQTETLCPKCKTGHLVIRRNEKTGQQFIGCSNYPKCDYTVQSVNAVKKQRVCPRCGGFLTLRPSKYGAFYGCSNYPRCEYTEEYNETKICPKCGSELRLRKGKYGMFWGCSNYPECNYIEKVGEER